MKKKKSLMKSTQKTAERVIKISLVTELEQLIGQLGQSSKKMTKEIDKGSKKLAKKLVKKFKVNPPVFEASIPEVETSLEETTTEHTAPAPIQKTVPLKKASKNNSDKIEI